MPMGLRSIRSSTRMRESVYETSQSTVRWISSIAGTITDALILVLWGIAAGEQLELPGIARWLGEAEVAERMSGEQPPARRALHEALLDQERLDDLLDRVARLGERRRNGLDPDRSAAVIERDQREVAPIHGVEAGGVDLERVERLVGDRAVDRRGSVDMREVAHALQQPARDARRAARATRDLVGALGRDLDAEHARAAVHD